MKRASRGAWTIAAAVLTLAGCEQPDTTLEPLPSIALEELDPARRRDYEARSEGLRHALAEPGKDPARLAQAYGSLGMWHHVYEQLDAAAPAYRNAAQLQPQDHRWPYYLADAHARRGNFAAARLAYDRVIELRPDYLPAFIRLAEIEIEAGRTDRADSLLGRAQTLDPRQPQVLMLLGKLALQGQDFESALPLLERALEGDPGRPETHYLLATAHRGMGQSAQAKLHLEASQGGNKQLRSRGYPDPLMSALDQVGQSAHFQENRAHRAFLDGHPEDAIAYSRAAIAAEPSNSNARLNLSAALLASGDVDAAIESLEEVIQLDHPIPPLDRARAHTYLAVILTSQSRPLDAEEHYREALRIVPGHPEASTQLARLLLRRGLASESLSHFETAIEADPAGGRLRLERAIALMELRRWGEARAALERDVNAVPGGAMLKLALARVLAASPDEVARDGSRSLELATSLDSAASSFASVETLAMAHAELGEFDRAVALQRFVREASGGMPSRSDASWRAQRLARYQRGLPCREPFVPDEVAILLRGGSVPVEAPTSVALPETAGERSGS